MDEVESVPLDDGPRSIDHSRCDSLGAAAAVRARYAYGAGITIPNYDVSRDGQRFIMIKDESGGPLARRAELVFRSRAPCAGDCPLSLGLTREPGT
jgi:hypothetical protein